MSRQNKRVNSKELIKYAINDGDATNLHEFINEKIKNIQEIIRNTIVSIKKNTYYEIFSNNDANLSITVLNDLYVKTKIILETAKTLSNKEVDSQIDALQKIIDKLEAAYSLYYNFIAENMQDSQQTKEPKAKAKSEPSADKVTIESME